MERNGAHGDLLVEIPLVSLAPVPFDPLLPLLAAVPPHSPDNFASFLVVLLP